MSSRLFAQVPFWVSEGFRISTVEYSTLHSLTYSVHKYNYIMMIKFFDEMEHMVRIIGNTEEHYF